MGASHITYEDFQGGGAKPHYLLWVWGPGTSYVLILGLGRMWGKLYYRCWVRGVVGVSRSTYTGYRGNRAQSHYLRDDIGGMGPSHITSADGQVGEAKLYHLC